MIAPALDALAAALGALLEGVCHGAIRRFSTPRRLCVVLEDVAAASPVEEKLALGPSVAFARKDGAWTPAAVGFARGKGIEPDALELVEGPKGQVIAARQRTGGEPTVERVAAALEGVVLGLPFRKSMRWGSGPARWGRPIQQVVAVYDGQRIPASVAGIETTDAVIGHRLDRNPPARVSGAADYLAALEARWVLADRAVRRERIRAGLAAVAQAEGVEVGWNEALLEEVTDLVEWPVPMGAPFDPDLLDLPPRLLVESMRVNQRVFPTLRAGRLHNLCVIVSNNPIGDPERIAAGNTRVLAARFYDARFFFAEDRKHSLEHHGAGIGRMRWVRGLGTMADKQERVARLGERLAGLFGAEPLHAFKAGSLCKSDLLTLMVGEFPELQGHMGRLYAAHQGLPEDVALAIEEHYQPRFAGDTLPATPAGRALALADRLDTLAGCFGVGLTPKGSADPQGLRRAANGVVGLLLEAGVRAPLGGLYAQALDGFAAQEGPELRLTRPPAEVQAQLVEFTLERLRATLGAEGHRTDVVNAVLAAGGEDLPALRARVEALTALSQAAEFGALLTTFKRALNISKDHPSARYDRKRLEAAVEQELADAVEALGDSVAAQVQALDAAGALRRLAALQPLVDRLFTDVLVMAEDPALRAARLGLVRAVADLFRAVADFRHLNTD